MKHKLVFDTSDAQSLLDSDNVGAYLRASDGTLITHTDVGGKKALDVRIAEGINVEVDLDAADDSVKSWTHDGTGNAIGSTGGALHISDGGGSLTVDATDFDIRDLDAAQDSVASHLFDGAGTALTSTLEGGKQALDVFVSNELEINDAALADTAIANAAKTLAVANTSESSVTTPLANRKYLWIHNNFNKTIFIGASGVTQADGFPMDPSVTMALRAGENVAVHFVGRTGDTPNIRTLELS
jgi:hypothetical protein